MLYNQFKLAKNVNNNMNMDELKKKFEELNNKLDQKDKEIKHIIAQKDIIINNILKENKNMNELFNKHEIESEAINKKLEILERNLKDINDNPAKINDNINNDNILLITKKK